MPIQAHPRTATQVLQCPQEHTRIKLNNVAIWEGILGTGSQGGRASSVVRLLCGGLYMGIVNNGVVCPRLMLFLVSFHSIAEKC